jgi:hypothetical protein
LHNSHYPIASKECRELLDRVSLSETGLCMA